MSNQSKTYILGAIGLAVIAGLLWWGNSNESNPENQSEISVGAIIPLTGPATYYGEQAKKGIEYAREELAILYPNLKLNVIYEDSFYTAKGGVDAYQKLKNANQVDAIMSLGSATSLALQPLATQDSILQMAVATSSFKYSTPDDLAFRTLPTVELQTLELTKFIQQGKYQRMSALYLNNDFGSAAWTALKKQLQEQNVDVQIGQEENFLLETRDFRTQISKIKNDNPEVVFLVGLATHYVDILKQAKEAGLQTQFISISSTEDPVLLDNAPNEAEGLIYTYNEVASDANSAAEEFAAGYQERYGVLPDSYAAEGYEGLRLVALAFSECQKNYDCIKNKLTNLRQYESVFGPLDFDNNGDVFYQFIFKTVKDGQFVRYDPADIN